MYAQASFEEIKTSLFVKNRLGDDVMPVITLQSGKMTKEQKKELIESFTESASNTLNIPKEYFTVIISEHEDENLGVGGKTVEEIKKNR